MRIKITEFLLFPTETKLLKGLEIGNSGIIRSLQCNLIRKVFDDFEDKKTNT